MKCTTCEYDDTVGTNEWLEGGGDPEHGKMFKSLVPMTRDVGDRTWLVNRVDLYCCPACGTLFAE